MHLSGYPDEQLGSFWTKVRDSVTTAVSAPVRAAVATIQNPKQNPLDILKMNVKASLAPVIAPVVEPAKFTQEYKAEIAQVAKPIVRGVAAYYTGGLSEMAYKAKEAMDAKKQAQADQEQLQRILNSPTVAPSPNVAPAASPVQPVVSIAPAANVVSQAQQQATSSMLPQSYTDTRERATSLMPYDAAMPTPVAPAQKMPQWLPYALGGGGLLLAVILATRR